MQKIEGKIDLLGAAEQLIDASITANIRKVAEDQNDETTLALIDLLAEYGITGRRMIEFATKISTIFELKDALSKKEGDG